TVPASGRCTPVRIFTRVDLPEPFSPMTACTSPARNSAEQERSATVGPKALASPVTRSATGPASAVRPSWRLLGGAGVDEVVAHIQVGRAAGGAGGVDCPARVKGDERTQVVVGGERRVDGERADLHAVALEHLVRHLNGRVGEAVGGVGQGDAVVGGLVL